MSSKARYLDDRRIHGVNSPQFTPFCELALEPGQCVVIAKGPVTTAGVESNLPIRLRLEVFGIHEQTPRTTDETELFGDPERSPTPLGSPGHGTFALIAAAELPSVRWRGINLEPFAPPPHRAVLSAMQSGDGCGGPTNARSRHSGRRAGLDCAEFRPLLVESLSGAGVTEPASP
jgi:hypothetical protein